MSSNTLKVENEITVVSSPRNTTNDEKKFMAEIKKIVSSWELGEEEKKFIESEEFLIYRYCYGYGWNIKEVPNFLKNMLKWRAKYKPQLLRLKDCQWASKGIVFNHGFDRKGNPVVYMVPKNDPFPNSPENKIEKVKVENPLNF